MDGHPVIKLKLDKLAFASLKDRLVNRTHTGEDIFLLIGELENTYQQLYDVQDYLTQYGMLTRQLSEEVYKSTATIDLHLIQELADALHYHIGIKDNFNLARCRRLLSAILQTIETDGTIHANDKIILDIKRFIDDDKSIK